MNVMIVAEGFRKVDSSDSAITASDLSKVSDGRALSAVEIILDIEHQNWNFKVQAGTVHKFSPVNICHF